jgi:arabinose-5-phosphate isomerase
MTAHLSLSLANQVVTSEMEAIAAIRDNLSSSFVEAVDLLAACEGRIAITGVGKSGLIARKIAATLSSTGTPAYFLHPVESMHGDLGFVQPQDTVIAISYSGKTEELLAILPSIRAIGTRVIAMTGGLDSPLAQLADIVLDCTVPREACPMNLVPTSSTTAALALGDALAICLMERKGLTAADFRRNHPGGNLGQRLALFATDIMHRENLPLARVDATLEEALDILDHGGFGATIITDDNGRLKGVLTDGDVRRLLCRDAVDKKKPVADIMRTQPSRVMPDRSAAELLEIMEEKLITVLPVVDENDVVLGMAHLHDLLGRGELRFTAREGVNTVRLC